MCRVTLSPSGELQLKGRRVLSVSPLLPGDVVGAGLFVRPLRAFFTLNGEFLHTLPIPNPEGDAFRTCCGQVLGFLEAHVTSNFGQSAFRFQVCCVHARLPRERI